ncbi:putative MFS transporter [Aspergillus undulatus]|uniref:putative MFS transporter n=1 Tax=Aspergillus undulatus TaxID=1810928 RepID=UPI003CCCFD16
MATTGKPDTLHLEEDTLKPTDVNLINVVRVPLTEEDNKRIRRKTDKRILAILVWVYFLQILDKTVLGYGATFGLQDDCNLTGSQYSLVGSIAPIAQLAWQPFSSFLIVKVPHRILMPVLVFSGLMATRFLLGLFEAGCLPLFSIITSQWYRRAEQPVRVAAWYGTNGIATTVAAALSYGLGHIKSGVLAEWQIIFLFVGLITVLSAPVTYLVLDNDIPSARFLDETEKLQAMERLRANQTGTGSREFKFSHVLEAALDMKTYLFIGMTILLNTGAGVTNVFGPLILSGLGFDEYKTTLLNMPFGAIQWIFIMLASYLTHHVRAKSIILIFFMLPVVAGLGILHAVPRTDDAQGALMAGYYLLAFLFGGIPLIISWIVGNTAGMTKQSVLTSLYQAASAGGNIIGPLLFNEVDAPSYIPGLRACLGIFAALVAVVLLQVVVLFFLNKSQGRRRVANGKPRKVVDLSMQNHFHQEEDAEPEHGADSEQTGNHAFMDLTDRENDEFVYIY